MNIALFGDHQDEIRPLLTRYRLNAVAEEPKVVIAYGGDGTLLRSEAAFPGIPKLPIKRSTLCTLCAPFSVDDALERLSQGEYTVRNQSKLEVRVQKERLVALNEVVIRNHNPRHALRFSLSISGHTFDMLIGDGVVIATSLGATGYFQSITKTSFVSGVGVAFNNLTTSVSPLVIPEDAFTATLSVRRGPALVYVDNLPQEVVLRDGEEVFVSRAEEKARIVVFT